MVARAQASTVRASLARGRPGTPVARHCVGTDEASLDGIVRNGMDVAIWRRALPRAVRAWAAAMAPRPVLHRVEVDAAAFDAESCLRVFSDEPARAWLAADLARLVRRFALLTGRRLLRLEVATEAEDSCRKFHVDALGLRLVCTYAGPGTEWVPEGSARREHLDAEWSDAGEINARIVPARRSIRHARAGWVCMLKGSAWPGNGACGAVHRSPPIEERGLRRLLLKIDAR